MRPKVNLPTPSVDEVARYLRLWDALDNYREQEDALAELFTQYPSNTGNTERERSGVLLKVVALNHFYSTNIFNVYAVAKRIMRISGFDENLRKGASSIIGELRDRGANGTGRDLYSFATKYCSHHQPKEFPIYDSYVHKALNYYYLTDKEFSARPEFAGMGDELARYHKNAADVKKNEDVPLRSNYETFKKVIETFRTHYKLTEYDLKQIDQYLWQLGKDWFPNRYQGQSKDAVVLKRIADSIPEKVRFFVDVKTPKHVEFNKSQSDSMREIGKVRAATLISNEYEDGWMDALRQRGLTVI